jgi:hypothetical protein
MLIREFTETGSGDAKRLMALVELLAGRSEDEATPKQISQDAFIDAAKSLGVNVTKENLGELINREPLKNVIEPLNPQSDVVRFKGNAEPAPGMTVNQAQDIVNQNAKAAMRRGMKK